MQGGRKPPLTRRAGGVHVRVGISVLAGVKHIGKVSCVGVVGAVEGLVAGTAVRVLVGLLLKAPSGISGRRDRGKPNFPTSLFSWV